MSIQIALRALHASDTPAECRDILAELDRQYEAVARALEGHRSQAVADALAGVEASLFVAGHLLEQGDAIEALASLRSAGQDLGALGNLAALREISAARAGAGGGSPAAT